VRYEGVLRAKTSVALVAGVILVVTGCGRVASHITTSPVAEVSPSTAATPSTTVESPAATTPGAAPTVPATHPPSPRSAPSPTPRSSASAPATPPPLAIAGVTFPTGEVGISYPTILLAASGGTPPYTWSIGSGALPGGLTLSSSTISGTPTVAGPFPFTLNLADSAGGTASAAQSVTTVAALSVAGRCDANPCSVEQGCDATCGSFGSQSGGLAPFKYSPSGQLPPGTSLNGLALGGQFTTVSAAAPFTFAVTVTDALGASGGVKAAFNVFPHISLQGDAKSGACFHCSAALFRRDSRRCAEGFPGQGHVAARRHRFGGSKGISSRRLSSRATGGRKLPRSSCPHRCEPLQRGRQLRGERNRDDQSGLAKGPRRGPAIHNGPFMR
jgi:hypothetical protein